MTQNDCIFCKIVGGEVPSATVYEDENFKAILDISPAAKGHVIIIPRNHAENIYELSNEDTQKVLLVASKIAKVMKEVLQCDGLNILQNNGEAAGQSVFHFHIHLIPRFPNDDVKITWKPGKYEEDIESVANSIRTRLM